MARILVTTDDLQSAGALRDAFQPLDEIVFVSGPDDVRERIKEEPEADWALILTGAGRPGAVREFVAVVSNLDGRVAVVRLYDAEEETPSGSTVELGVDERFRKPIDPDEIALVVRRLAQRKRLQSQIGIVGNSAPIQEVVERVAQIAPVGSTVLITGESGTGKELVARGLHKLSPRRGHPFIAVNIAALPETLLESELFGHEKGAFTGANSRRKGMFELANEGTIFLDEIAEMPSGPQTRLLRVLEQREFMRVGGSDYIKVDVRVIAATNRHLREAVELNEFRRDLYYRLNVLHIHMPPLRERRDDIPLLVHEFIRELSHEHGRAFKGISNEAMDILVRYSWPGNVRELRNLIESMVVLQPGSMIRPLDIPPEVRRGADRSLPARISLSPVVPSRAPSGTDETPAPAHLPEMEFIFRTMVDLKYDVEDLRREFERYKRRHPELLGAREAGVVEAPAHPSDPFVEEAVDISAGEDRQATEPVGVDQQVGDVIQFRPGMTMEELERAAIIATLKSVDGNRRRASEKLGIGERTLYRKLKEYSIDA